MSGAPKGLGMWIAFRPPQAVERLLRTGCRWVAPRAGQDGWNDRSCKLADLQAYHDAGLGVYPWIYPSMARWRNALDGFHQLWDTGLCDGLIVDWEAPWCRSSPSPEVNAQYKAENEREAHAFVDALQSSLPHAWIATAPMDYRRNHPTAPWEQFDRLDAAMPQVYWFEHDDRGAAYHLAQVMPQWAQTGKPVYPIGCTYRPYIRSKISLLTMPAKRIVDEMLVFLNDPKWHGGPISLYSLEASWPGVEDAIAQWSAPAASQCYVPDDTPTTPGTPKAKKSSGEYNLQLGDANAPNDSYTVDRKEAKADGGG